MSNRIFRASLLIIACTVIALWAAPAHAYDKYTQTGDDGTNCAACHGDFRSNIYISNTDGMLWGNLHNIHRQDMLGGDCDTCHSSGGRVPTFMASSAGGDGLATISCVGCHGRAEDDTPANPDFGSFGGYGAGLRQQHHVNGVAICANCHQDADPANYTPVGEEVLPPYYANPGTGHPDMPTASCNDDASEDFAGATEGLDNDGDAVYDVADADCTATSTPELVRGRTALSQNTPNPFNPMTSISYEVMVAGKVRLRVFDASGQLVRTLVDGD